MVKVRDEIDSHVILQDINQWLDRFRPRYTEVEWLQLKAATTLFKSACHQQNTDYQLSCYAAGLECVEILNDLNVDAATLAAALLYFPVGYCGLPEATISEKINPEVAKLVMGVVQLSDRQRFSQGPTVHHDKLRKMLLAVVEDVRVVLIKLAERLVALRALRYTDDLEAQRAIATVTRNMYAPLANRLGIGFIKWELEDYAFRYLEPEGYKKIASLLAEKRLDREHYVKKVIEIVKQALAKEAIEQAEVYGRVKHIYSIWRKMSRKAVDFDEIYDVRAIRIIVPEIRDCYATLGVLHALWQHVPKEFDDYIATPKENGYRSLHTAVYGPEGRVIEIQIRTDGMHNEAELGVAAHWLYKEGGKQTPDYHNKVASLRKVLQYNHECEDADAADAAGEALRSEVFSDRVYVLTPQGDIIDLPQGATPIDFAYHVHTEVGHRCRGAKVNGAIVPLNYVLNSGEQLEILAAKQGQPSRDWLRMELGYVKSARARAKIHAWFRKYAPAPVEKPPAVRVEPTPLKPPEIAIKRPSKPGQRSRSDVTIEGIGDLMCQFAKCCKPVPGDAIIGYITLGRGVTVHRTDCSNVKKLPFDSHPRLMPIHWANQPENQYPVDIHIQATDRQGLLSDVIHIFQHEKINVLGVNTYTDQQTNLANLALTLEIKHLEYLEGILNRIQQLPNVISTRRTQGSQSIRKNKYED